MRPARTGATLVPNSTPETNIKPDNDLRGDAAPGAGNSPPPARWRLQGLAGGVWRGRLLVALVALAASASGIANDYAQDDVPLVFEDSRVHELSGASLREILTTSYWPEPFHRDLYRPLATLSFALQWAAGGGQPVVFRIVSYLLYALVAVAVLALGRRLLPGGVALGVALLFAAHPVHVEAVALAVNQGEQWVGLFTLLAVIRYLDARRKGWLSGRDWGLIAVLYLLACLFKEHAVVMPGLLLAAELALLRPAPVGPAAARLAPGFAALAAIGAAFLWLRSSVLGNFVGSFTAEALVGQDRWGRFLTMLQVVPEWIRLLVWPAHLQGDYSPSVILQATGWGTAQTLGLLILAGVALIGWLMRHRVPTATFGLLWAAVALVPVSNILVASGIVMAERTLYTPSIGFLLAIGGVTTLLLTPHDARPRATHRRVAIAATALLVVAGVVRSGVRHPDWRSQVYYWAKTVQDAPLSYRAHHAHAQLLWGLGYEGGSVSAFHTAMALHPPAWWIRNELANRFRYRGECYPALELYEESLRISPEQPAVYASRVACLLYLGHYDAAMTEADRAIAAGSPRADFESYRAVADSARRAGAPPRTVQITVKDPDERW